MLERAQVAPEAGRDDAEGLIGEDVQRAQPTVDRGQAGQQGEDYEDGNAVERRERYMRTRAPVLGVPMRQRGPLAGTGAGLGM